MEKRTSGIKPESWLVSAGRTSEAGAPLNVPLIPASNFIIGAVPPSLLRLSVGIEDGDDLWTDLDSAICSAAQ